MRFWRPFRVREQKNGNDRNDYESWQLAYEVASRTRWKRDGTAAR